MDLNGGFGGFGGVNMRLAFPKLSWVEGCRGVGVFFGTFDPVHENHVRIARHALQSEGLYHILFVPLSFDPRKPYATDLGTRKRLLMQRIRSEDDFRVSVFHNPGTMRIDVDETVGLKYVSAWLASGLREHNKDMRVTFLVGGDDDLEWYFSRPIPLTANQKQEANIPDLLPNIQRIRDPTSFLITPETLGPTVGYIRSRTQQHGFDVTVFQRGNGKQKGSEEPCCEFVHENVSNYRDTENITSVAIRLAIQAGTHIPASVLHPSVLALIRGGGLYVQNPLQEDLACLTVMVVGKGTSAAHMARTLAQTLELPLIDFARFSAKKQTSMTGLTVVDYANIRADLETLCIHMKTNPSRGYVFLAPSLSRDLERGIGTPFTVVIIPPSTVNSCDDRKSQQLRRDMAENITSHGGGLVVGAGIETYTETFVSETIQNARALVRDYPRDPQFCNMFSAPDIDGRGGAQFAEADQQFLQSRGADLAKFIRTDLDGTLVVLNPNDKIADSYNIPAARGHALTHQQMLSCRLRPFGVSLLRYDSKTAVCTVCRKVVASIMCEMMCSTCIGEYCWDDHLFWDPSPSPKEETGQKLPSAVEKRIEKIIEERLGPANLITATSDVDRAIQVKTMMRAMLARINGPYGIGARGCSNKKEQKSNSPQKDTFDAFVEMVATHYDWRALVLDVHTNSNIGQRPPATWKQLSASFASIGRKSCAVLQCAGNINGSGELPSDPTEVSSLFFSGSLKGYDFMSVSESSNAWVGLVAFGPVGAGISLVPCPPSHPIALVAFELFAGQYTGLRRERYMTIPPLYRAVVSSVITRTPDPQPANVTLSELGYNLPSVPALYANVTDSTVWPTSVKDGWLTGPNRYMVTASPVDAIYGYAKVISTGECAGEGSTTVFEFLPSLRKPSVSITPQESFRVNAECVLDLPPGSVVFASLAMARQGATVATPSTFYVLLVHDVLFLRGELLWRIPANKRALIVKGLADTRAMVWEVGCGAAMWTGVNWHITHMEGVQSRAKVMLALFLPITLQSVSELILATGLSPLHLLFAPATEFPLENPGLFYTLGCRRVEMMAFGQVASPGMYGLREDRNIICDCGVGVWTGPSSRSRWCPECGTSKSEQPDPPPQIHPGMPAALVAQYQQHTAQLPPSPTIPSALFPEENTNPAPVPASKTVKETYRPHPAHTMPPGELSELLSHQCATGKAEKRVVRVGNTDVHVYTYTGKMGHGHRPTEARIVHGLATLGSGQVVSSPFLPTAFPSGMVTLHVPMDKLVCAAPAPVGVVVVAASLPNEEQPLVYAADPLDDRVTPEVLQHIQHKAVSPGYTYVMELRANWPLLPVPPATKGVTLQAVVGPDGCELGENECRDAALKLGIGYRGTMQGKVNDFLRQPHVQAAIAPPPPPRTRMFRNMTPVELSYVPTGDGIGLDITHGPRRGWEIRVPGSGDRLVLETLWWGRMLQRAASLHPMHVWELLAIGNPRQASHWFAQLGSAYAKEADKMRSALAHRYMRIWDLARQATDPSAPPTRHSKRQMLGPGVRLDQVPHPEDLALIDTPDFQVVVAWAAAGNQVPPLALHRVGSVSGSGSGQPGSDRTTPGGQAREVRAALMRLICPNDPLHLIGYSPSAHFTTMAHAKWPSVELPPNGSLGNLPDELLIKIFEQLPVTSLAVVGKVCQKWKFIVQSTASLKQQQHAPGNGVSDPIASYHALYDQLHGGNMGPVQFMNAMFEAGGPGFGGFGGFCGGFGGFNGFEEYEDEYQSDSEEAYVIDAAADEVDMLLEEMEAQQQQGMGGVGGDDYDDMMGDS